MATGLWGVPLRDAVLLTLVEYRLLEGGYRRKIQAEHERDTWHAWMIGEFTRRQFSFEDMMKIATGKGRAQRDPNDPDGGLKLQKAMQVQAEFERYFAEQHPQGSNGHG